MRNSSYDYFNISALMLVTPNNGQVSSYHNYEEEHRGGLMPTSVS